MFSHYNDVVCFYCSIALLFAEAKPAKSPFLFSLDFLMGAIEHKLSKKKKKKELPKTKKTKACLQNVT